jgi:hypothetical protein
LAVALAGAGALGLAAGATFGAFAIAREGRAGACAPGARCAADGGAGAGTASALAFAAGGVGLGGAALLWLTAPGRVDAPARRAVGVTPAVGGAPWHVSWRAAF